MSSIARSIAREAGEERAARVVLELREAFRFLGGSPGAGHAREDLTEAPEVRFWPVSSSLIAYAVDRRPIGILAIVHGGRDPRGLRGRFHQAGGENTGAST